MGLLKRLFGKSEQPTDIRTDNEGWQAGDLAECMVEGGWVCPPGETTIPHKGRIYRVLAVTDDITFDGKFRIIGLMLEGVGNRGWQCAAVFRKLKLTQEPCEEEFTVWLKDKLKVPHAR